MATLIDSGNVGSADRGPEGGVVSDAVDDEHAGGGDGQNAEPVGMVTIVSPPGFERIFAAVAAFGEEDLFADPERLANLAAEYGTEVLGDYPADRSGAVVAMDTSVGA